MRPGAADTSADADAGAGAGVDAGAGNKIREAFRQAHAGAKAAATRWLDPLASKVAHSRIKFGPRRSTSAQST